jgi:hypothetical protein
LVASEKFEVDPQMLQGLDCGRGSGTNGIGHIESGKAANSFC